MSKPPTFIVTNAYLNSGGPSSAMRHLLVQFIPPLGDIKEDIRIDAASFCRAFHCETGALQFVAGLLFALDQGALDLVRVQRL